MRCCPSGRMKSLYFWSTERTTRRTTKGLLPRFKYGEEGSLWIFQGDEHWLSKWRRMSAVQSISLLTCLPEWPLVGYCGREEASQLTTCLLFLLLFFLSFSLAAAGRRRRRLCLGFAFSLTMHGAEREEESFFVLWKAFRGEGREPKRQGSYWRIPCLGSLVILF